VDRKPRDRNGDADLRGRANGELERRMILVDLGCRASLGEDRESTLRLYSIENAVPSEEAVFGGVGRLGARWKIAELSINFLCVSTRGIFKPAETMC